MNTDKLTGIAYRRWTAKDPRGSFVLIHGLGAHTGRWRALAKHLARSGFSSYALELRGFGCTKDSPGYINSFKIYLQDIMRLRQIVLSENPGLKIFSLGESMGALAVLLTAIENPGSFDGVVMISPALTSRLKFKLLEYLDMSFAALSNPRKTFKMPFDSAMCTRDPYYQRLLDRDRREHRVASARLLSQIAFAQLKSRFQAANLKVPTLFLVAGDDQLVDSRDTIKLFREIRNPDKKIIEYPQMRHALSIDIDKEQVFNDIIEWAGQRC
jgi:alpha-beta hydrolase superfamily lysophospholipase